VTKFRWNYECPSCGGNYLMKRALEEDRSTDKSYCMILHGRTSDAIPRLQSQLHAGRSATATRFLGVSLRASAGLCITRDRLLSSGRYRTASVARQKELNLIRPARLYLRESVHNDTKS
jgi:hypothetical protein